MAVINSKGIVGITEFVSIKYSRVQSILNKNSKINAKLKNSNHFGSLTWNGFSYNTVQLLDIPRQAVIKTGDTIITGGNSTIFPAGIPIGKVINIGNNYEISIIALAEKIIEQLGSKSEIIYVPYQEAYGEGFEDMERRVPNLALIEELVGWSPKRDLTTIISDIAREMGH